MYQPKEPASPLGWWDKGEITFTSRYSFVVPDRLLGAYHVSIPTTASATRSFLEISATLSLRSNFPNDQHEKS